MSIDCNHEWSSGDVTRACLSCGQIRTFPADSKVQPKILWQDKHSQVDLKELPAVDKAEIARLAKAEGVREVEGWTRIPMTTLRAWVGTYCREPKDDHRQEILADYGQMSIVEVEKKWGMPRGRFYYLRRKWEKAGVVIPAAFTDRPAEVIKEEPAPTPAPGEKRHYLKRRSLEYWGENREKLMADYQAMTIRDFFKAWHISSSQWAKVRDLLGIPKKSMAPGLGVALAAGALPIFPAFSESWLAPVKIEWLKTYAELKKLEGK